MTCSFYVFNVSLRIFCPWAKYAIQAGKGAEWGEATDGACAVGLWEELRPGRQAWLETGPCMGRARLPAVMADESLDGALLWKTEATDIEKVRLWLLSNVLLSSQCGQKVAVESFLQSNSRHHPSPKK